MTKLITTRAAAPADLDTVKTLLSAENLPTEDLRPDLLHFFIAENNDAPVAAIGLDPYGPDALLRSMIVDRNWRSHGIASRLVRELEQHARDSGIQQLFLVTNTAEAYFSRKGFHRINRLEVPESVARSAEFNGLCPASAVIMKKVL